MTAVGEIISFQALKKSVEIHSTDLKLLGNH